MAAHRTRPPAKLYQVLPAELRDRTPYSLMLANRVPSIGGDYGLAMWMAVELPPDMESRFYRLARGRAGS